MFTAAYISFEWSEEQGRGVLHIPYTRRVSSLPLSQLRDSNHQRHSVHHCSVIQPTVKRRNYSVSLCYHCTPTRLKVNSKLLVGEEEESRENGHEAQRARTDIPRRPVDRWCRALRPYAQTSGARMLHPSLLYLDSPNARFPLLCLFMCI